MRTDLFDFALPEDRIALRPVAPRDAARLLVVRPQAAGELDDRSMRDLPALLCRGDALVGGAKNVTCRSGAAAAIARMNGKCQTTSPMPGLT